MDKLCPHHHHHYLKSSFFQTPFSHNQPRSHSLPTSHVFGTTDTSFLQTPSPLSASSPSSLSKHRFSDDLNELKSLDSVKLMHAQMMKMPKKFKTDDTGRNLITCYLKFGDFTSATKFFFVDFAQNYQFWSYFLKEYKSFGGKTYQVLDVFGELHSKGVVFDSKVLTIVLKLCVGLMNIWLGLEIHACLIKRGFDMDVHLKCSLMNFYGRCCGIESANQVFNEMSDRNVLLWNEAIVVNLQNDRPVETLQLFRDMQFSFVKANSVSLVKVLQACGKMGALDEGKQIHGYIFRYAFQSNLLICNCLISMYSKNKKIELARIIFDSMENYNQSSWNSIISGYASLGYLNDACKLLEEMERSNTKPDVITWNCLLSGHFLHGSYNAVLTILRRMQEVGFKPNSSSITSVLQAVSELGLLKTGKEIHCYVIRNGLDYDVYVGTSLLDMYVKNACLNYARSVFNSMENRNIFAWNSLISGYSYNGLFEEALELLNRMKEEGFKPDLVTWNGLVSGYSMQGRSEEALAVIDEIKTSGLTPNVVSWTALISGCSQKENYEDSLKYFNQMLQEGVRPNSATISCILRAYAGLSMLQKGKEMHCFCIRTGFIEDVYVATSLIDMYSKSGNIKNAHEVFDKIQNKTLASWNCMIMGFSIYGLGTEAILHFNKMCESGIDPDAITFTALLSACKNSGLVDEGWKFFDSMSTDYKIIPTIEHFSCMVDLLGRAGYLDEAWDFIQTMPLQPDATVWGALLGSCRNHRNLKLAEIAANNLFKLEPYNSANYILMMNLYSILNRWEDVDRVKDLMGAVGVKNRQVWSSIEIDQTVHMFLSGDRNPHPDSGEIYFELYQLVSEMKKLGYVPDANCVYQNISQTEKEKMLLSHPEKLSITYGLMKMKSSAPIRVIKNTRVCSDCHTAAKYMSLIKSREIFLKDGVRFHHFSEGKCSCKDCW